MPLTSGTRLGPYGLVAPLGAGRMGEVCKERDTRLARDVAIKVLPAEVASDRERLARFEQKARSASALNHPNIVAVYDVGRPPDGKKRALFVGRDLGRGNRLSVQAISGGAPLPMTSEGRSFRGPISPDGRFVAALGPEGKVVLYRPSRANRWTYRA